MADVYGVTNMIVVIRGGELSALHIQTQGDQDLHLCISIYSRWRQYG